MVCLDRDPILALTLTRHHPVHALDVERPLWQVRMHMRMHTQHAHAHAACTCTRGTFLPNLLSLLTHFVPVPLWQARLVPRLEDGRCVLVFLVDHR